MKFATFTLGCKVNQFESQAMENILISRGHSLAKAGEGCDACIINTCTVTGISAGKSRRAVRRLKRLEPDALIAVCGCLSQLMPDEIAAIGADIIGGSGDRHEFILKLEELFENYLNENSIEDFRQRNNLCSEENVGNPKERDVFEELPCGVAPIAQITRGSQSALPLSISRSKTMARTRALLKIQDGCGNYCAYCVIPYARGRSRSLPLDRIFEQARLLSEQGFREIVITGIEISAYGKDLAGSPSLIDALIAVSNAASGIRIRLGSIDPRVVDEEFCRGLANVSDLCDHFHLSVQSGCDATLRRMGRKYTTENVLDAILSLRKLFPNCGITGDLITGFPGESDSEFEKTQQFIEHAEFSDIHIFPFSKRPGTRAADMPDQVGKGLKAERARLISEIQAELSQSFRLSQIGKTLEVLFEKRRDGFRSGYSPNYLKVAVRAEKGLAKNDVRRVPVESVKDGVLQGKVI